MRLRALVSSSVVFISIVGCTTKETSSVATGDRVSPTYSGPAELAFCSTVQVHSSPVAVTGVAQYKRRNVFTTGQGGLTSAAAATTHPIRLAEVRVTDASGNVVQCGQTDASGNFTVNLPQGAVDYTVSVNSRAYNTTYRASVLNRPEANQFYSLSVTANPSAGTPINVGTLTAEVTGEILGAAFNILDQIYAANIFLNANVGPSGVCPFTNCRNVNSANPIDKVSVYWEKGYNPNGYFGSSSGLSFYLPDYSRIFILGGVNGNVETADTDHFDNSVIIHEYGHFLEDSVFESDSPGGSHNGNAVIDPRLAWSEGWGNFFQAAVLNDPHYYDTIGNADGSTALAFAVDIEEVTNAPIKDNPVLSETGVTGEGIFREFAVSRLLWDAIDAVQETISPGSVADNRSSEFDEIWAALTKTVNGFKDADFAYRNVGHVHLAQVKMQISESGSDWTAIRAGNRHKANTSEYAEYLEACASDPGFVIDPQSGDTSTSLSGSHLFRNNDFYHIKFASAGSRTITLEYNDADGTGTEGDLDLFVYNENARYGSTSDMLGYSRNDPDGTTAVGSWNPATSETETVTATFSAGVYLINVQAYTNGGSGTYTAAGNQNYRIKIDGVLQCPVSLTP